ncbi:putative membrane protein [Halobacteroides halobius DSM 5150]|uniref:Putative membrane protein n=1 Tax=Halobacteroides halobius (strain ATCC 35273 / DSM 5150 / MD-1) TaxID=748449 RepID=L0K9N3_HALHC|nr:SHOCT domain-containing protein [Halobacteroides halobius]AGB40788.1 putative membrane protein [Halobacteroides halobius DSM 5150]
MHGMMRGWGFPMRGSFGGGFLGGEMIMMGIFWIVIIVGAFYLINKSNNPVNNRSRIGTTPEDDALKIARRRYAKGEISKAEFEEIKEELQ